MAGGAPEGKGDPNASGSGSGGDADEHQHGGDVQVQQQQDQQVSVVGGDMYSVGFISRASAWCQRKGPRQGGA